MLDGIKAAGIAHYMGEYLQNNVVLVESIKEARGELTENKDKYNTLLVEPFPYIYRDTSDLLGFLQDSKEKGLAVIIYSTQEEETMKKELLLEKETHYNHYVSKYEPGSIKHIKRILDALSPSRP